MELTSYEKKKLLKVDKILKYSRLVFAVFLFAIVAFSASAGFKAWEIHHWAGYLNEPVLSVLDPHNLRASRGDLDLQLRFHVIDCMYFIGFSVPAAVWLGVVLLAQRFWQRNDRLLSKLAGRLKELGELE